MFTSLVSKIRYYWSSTEPNCDCGIWYLADFSSISPSSKQTVQNSVYLPLHQGALCSNNTRSLVLGAVVNARLHTSSDYSSTIPRPLYLGKHSAANNTRSLVLGAVVNTRLHTSSDYINTIPRPLYLGKHSAANNTRSLVLDAVVNTRLHTSSDYISTIPRPLYLGKHSAANNTRSMDNTWSGGQGRATFQDNFG